MMERTDRHDRYFLRLISRRARLYTEMLTASAVLHGDRGRLLGHDRAEHPLAVQLGGSDPAMLAEATRICADYGYDEVNLNVGCPSSRVQDGRFGACLMAEPDLVARCVAAMSEALARAGARIPVTIKTRIGIDDQDSEPTLARFVQIVAAGGCQTFIIHARKAWLKGLSPRQNREIPPLRYDVVYRLKRAHPDLNIVINGGVTTLDEAAAHLTQVDGVMLGRAAYQNPYLLSRVDQTLFGDPPRGKTRHDVVEALMPYVDDEVRRGTRLGSISRHVLGLFNGVPGGRAWRRHLSERAHRAGAGADVMAAAAAKVAAAGSVKVPGV